MEKPKRGLAAGKARRGFSKSIDTYTGFPVLTGGVDPVEVEARILLSAKLCVRFLRTITPHTRRRCSRWRS